MGESLRHYIGHRNVMITYGISTAYCFADAIDKTIHNYRVKNSVNISFSNINSFIYRKINLLQIVGEKLHLLQSTF